MTTHNPRARRNAGKTYRVWCSCSPEAARTVLGPFGCAMQAATKISDTHREKKVTS